MAAGHIFFSSTCQIFIKNGHKGSMNKFQCLKLHRAFVVTPTQLIDNNIYLDIKKYISEYSIMNIRIYFNWIIRKALQFIIDGYS